MGAMVLGVLYLAKKVHCYVLCLSIVHISMFVDYAYSVNITNARVIICIYRNLYTVVCNYSIILQGFNKYE